MTGPFGSPLRQALLQPCWPAQGRAGGGRSRRAARRGRGCARTSAGAGAAGPRWEAETPGLKIAINSTPTHFFGTRYPIECQKVSYTLYIVSKSVIYALYSVKKCLIHSISCYFQSWCFTLGTPECGARVRREQRVRAKNACGIAPMSTCILRLRACQPMDAGLRWRVAQRRELPQVGASPGVQVLEPLQRLQCLRAAPPAHGRGAPPLAHPPLA